MFRSSASLSPLIVHFDISRSQLAFAVQNLLVDDSLFEPAFCPESARLCWPGSPLRVVLHASTRCETPGQCHYKTNSRSVSKTQLLHLAIMNIHLMSSCVIQHVSSYTTHSVNATLALKPCCSYSTSKAVQHPGKHSWYAG